MSLQIFFSIAALGLLEANNCLMFISDVPLFSDNCLIMCYVPMYISTMTELQFISYLQLLQDRFIAINKIITLNRNELKEIDVESIMKAETTIYKICQLEKLYSILQESSMLLSKAFGIQNIVMITIQFFTLTTLMYDCCIKLVRYIPNSKTIDGSIFDSAIWGLTFFIEIITICWMSDQTKYEANKIRMSIQHFNVNGDVTSEKMVNIIKGKIFFFNID